MGLFNKSPFSENAIAGFNGEYRFLSNFWMHPFTMDGWRWASSEHAYQASKSQNPDEWRYIQNLRFPGQAKKAGLRLTLRNDWVQVRVDFMKIILDHKFEIPELAEKLVATGNAELIELNTWGDSFWGVSSRDNQGQNNLGKILMNKRKELQS